jgi:archaetidylinositol phosphate synthase
MHTRDHRSLLAGAEKRLLIALAERLPPWITSDHLTLVGLLAMPAAGGCFARIPHAPWSAAAFVVALACNWFGDSLDGTLARVRDQQRPRYGYYVDHVLDLAGAAALFAGIGASGLMHPALAIALAAAYFLVAAESYLATHARGVFRISFAGFGPTELRIVLAAGAVIVVHKPWVEMFGVHARLFDVGGLVAIAGMVVAFAIATIRNTRALYLAEPLPVRVPSPRLAPRPASPAPFTRGGGLPQLQWRRDATPVSPSVGATEDAEVKSCPVSAVTTLMERAL